MKITRWCLTASFLLCTIALLSGCGDPDKNKLLFRPEINVARTVNTSDASSTNMKMMGMEMTIGASKEMSYVMTPTAIDENGVVSLDVVIDHIRTETTGLDGMLKGAGMPQLPGMDDMFGEKAMQKALESMKGEKFTLRVSRNGEVLGVDGADAIASKIADAYAPPAHLPAEQIKTGIRQGYGNQGTLEMMKQIFIKTPDKALNPGDTWQETVNRGSAEMPVEGTSTVTVGERNAGLLTLSTTDQYQLDFSKGPMGAAMASGKASAKITGQGTGTAEYEEATGWPRKWVTTGKASGSVSAMQGMEMPMEISAKFEINSFPKPQ
ncbi:MAG: hypothetical protein IT365_01645 [Candidatus Hydrogenedentes bacterium]|nr:hypothetical protein [Candidatus Hydrogenedentota bacterium]